VRVVVLLGTVGIVVAGVAGLLESSPRRSSTNSASEAGLLIHLQAGQTLCQPGEPVAAGTAALGLDAGDSAGPGPALEASLEATSGPGASGRLAAGWRQGPIRIPLRPTLRHESGGTVCVRDLGPGAVSLGGAVPAGGWVVQIDGHGLGGRARFEYFRAGSESWFALLPTLIHRLTLGKGQLIRHWAWVAWLLLLVLAVGLATRTVLAQEGR
jgi:hypothetical protein